MSVIRWKTKPGFSYKVRFMLAKRWINHFYVWNEITCKKLIFLYRNKFERYVAEVCHKVHAEGTSNWKHIVMLPVNEEILLKSWKAKAWWFPMVCASERKWSSKCIVFHPFRLNEIIDKIKDLSQHTRKIFYLIFPVLLPILLPLLLPLLPLFPLLLT